MKPRFATAFVLAGIAACSAPATPPPVVPSRAPAPAPATPAPAPDASGIWLGALHVGGAGLRIQLRLELSHGATCSLDSLDQHAAGIPCTASITGMALTVDVPAVKGTFHATLSADGNTLDGSWSQGAALSLVLTRQRSAIEPSPLAIDPALPPVDVAQLQEVLDKDLAAALGSGALAPGTDAGVTIGVVQHGVRRIFSYGTAKPDSVFEIGSVSKTFTGLLLAQLVEQKRVRLDEPVRSLLPAGTVAAPPAGPEITLVDLSAQRSGLPRMPDNFQPADPTDPYADYDKKALFAYLAGHGVALPAAPEFAYSNLGVGLLGEALAERAGRTYDALVRDEITGPLGMKDTAVALTPAMRARFVAGHDGNHKPAHAWNLNVLAGAGGIRSTAADMLTYLEAQLHPDHLARGASSTAAGKTLAAALAASHVIHGDAMPGMHIALNWLRIDDTGAFWHDGGTGGYSSFALFDPEDDFAIIVLSNTAPDDQFTDDLGKHIARRLTGRPAASLGPQ